MLPVFTTGPGEDKVTGCTQKKIYSKYSDSGVPFSGLNIWDGSPDLRLGVYHQILSGPAPGWSAEGRRRRDF